MMSSTLESDIILNFTVVQSKINRSVDGALVVHGISFTEFQVMRCLYNSPEMTMKRIHLAEKVGLTASGVTRLLAPMEKRGLVKKRANSRDARVSLVKLTSAGKKLFIDAEKTVDKSSESILSSTKLAQKTKLLELLAQIA
jgi:DNA-binding MarR family transcriptional regulator